MEDLDQKKEEAVIEQRPSTKYGRTAYQQQLQEEQKEKEQEMVDREDTVESSPYQQNPYQQNPYEQYQQNPYQQYTSYTPYQEPKKEVKKVFANILMVIVAVAAVVNLITTYMVLDAYYMGNSVEEVVQITLAIAEQPLYVVISTIADFLLMAAIALLILDIIQLSRAKMKITGAILFAIFLRPAYFIWRAHLLGQKKTAPIVYCVMVYVVKAIGFFMTMMAACEMVLRTMY